MTTTAQTPTVGMLIRRHRESAGLTQEALAGRAGVAMRSVQRIENGVTETPRLGMLRSIAAALGVPVNALIPEPRHASNLPEGSGSAPHTPN